MVNILLTCISRNEMDIPCNFFIVLPTSVLILLIRDISSQVVNDGMNT